jgi:glucose/arabinose dehydrogenase
VPAEPYELIVGGFQPERQHAAKPFAFDGAGSIYVTSGAPSNACQVEDRTEGSPGQDPCPLLERFAGIWQFGADQTGQDQMADGSRYATGIRHAVAVAWNPGVNELFVVQHGRDVLHGNWPDLYTVEQNAELPAEEFMLVREGSDFGWPYCYYDPIQNRRVLAPEYGGDGGNEVGRCAEMDEPVLGLPAHYAPNDLLFYQGDQFPERYRNGAFIAFHGSWNRAPLQQEGFNVVFIPMSGASPSGEWTVFADGFAGAETIAGAGDARHRPTGLAVGPDGSLYVADSVRGRIWRVLYRG